MTITISEDGFDRYRTWTRKHLPGFNTAIELGNAPVEALIAAALPYVEELVQTISERFVDKLTARSMIQVLGFTLSSVERHLQSAKNVPGTGFNYFANLESGLIELGRIAEHPPRDSHYTYWTWNRGDQPMTFTGDPQEIVFSNAVNEIDRLLSETCELLRPLCQQQIALNEPLASTHLQECLENVIQVGIEFQRFMDRTADNRRMMEPMFFMTRMRTYLTKYPIGGTTWEGVNAANVISIPQTDYLLGLADEAYPEVVGDRFRFLTTEDRILLQQDMNRIPLLDVILKAANLSRIQIGMLSADEIALLLHTLPSALSQPLNLYLAVCRTYAKAFNKHFSLIGNYLVKPAALLTSEQKAGLPVSPDEGTGKHSHEDTNKLRKMRADHITIKTLMNAHQLLLDKARWS